MSKDLLFNHKYQTYLDSICTKIALLLNSMFRHADNFT